MVIFWNEGSFTWISSVQNERDIWNEMTCRVLATPLIINRIKILYDRYLLSELA